MVSKAAEAAKEARHAASLARSTHGFVPTPDSVGEDLVKYPFSVLDDLRDGALVLEPSAGDGALVAWILKYLATDELVTVIAVEPDEERFAQLAARFAGDQRVRPVLATLEQYLQAEQPTTRFHAVVMNPPFSTPDVPRLWPDHALACWDRLAPGGRLVTITPSVDPPHTGAQKWLGLAVAEHGHSVRYHVERRLGECHRWECGADEHLIDAAARRAGFPERFRVLTLVKPLGRDMPDWQIQPAAGEPVDVVWAKPGPDGPLVQRYRDAVCNRIRVMRRGGLCHGCGQLLWVHDDGREDALDWHACCVLEAAAAYPRPMVGPTIGLCMSCFHDSARHAAAEKVARTVWAEPDQGTGRPPVANGKPPGQSPPGPVQNGADAIVAPAAELCRDGGTTRDEVERIEVVELPLGLPLPAGGRRRRRSAGDPEQLTLL